jgi:hypothetical protein
VLRLLEIFRPEDVLAGIREAIARGAIGFDAVKLRLADYLYDRLRTQFFDQSSRLQRPHERPILAGHFPLLNCLT